MKYILILLSIAFTTIVFAKEVYPKVYAKQGDPLYKSAKYISSFKGFPSLKESVIDYEDKLEQTKIFGYKADNTYNKKDVGKYLIALRSLQNSYDKIRKLSIKILLNSMKKNDYDTFTQIVKSGSYYYFTKPMLKNKIIAYYKDNKKKGKIKEIDKIIRDDKNTIKVYSTSSGPIQSQFRTETNKEDKEIILLSTKWCGYCKKAKKFLKSKDINYKEYDIDNSSYGKSLYKQHNGTGVPLMIIGEKVLRGYSEQSILNAIK